VLNHDIVNPAKVYPHPAIMGHELKPTPMTHAYKDGSHSYPWHSGRGKLSRHLLILIALFLNGCIAALALVVQWIDIPITDASLPTIGSMKTKYSYKSLLAPGASMLGSINGFISGAAIAALVTAYAKRRGLGQGISFNEIGHLSQLCECLFVACRLALISLLKHIAIPASGGLPLALSRYAIFGLLFFTVDSLTRSVSLRPSSHETHISTHTAQPQPCTEHRRLPHPYGWSNRSGFKGRPTGVQYV
jgi:hypothetical protein